MIAGRKTPDPYHEEARACMAEPYHRLRLHLSRLELAARRRRNALKGSRLLRRGDR
jgi:hypothetical protein